MTIMKTVDLGEELLTSQEHRYRKYLKACKVKLENRTLTFKFYIVDILSPYRKKRKIDKS